uniref:Uncharacterized protein n=1 Tax=Magnetococcus massalia (strain MO-1) TaxID=451514 RepID=A0A1S7LFP7_MAGMO|nr:Protein of unknown function [Candidatus Magnetococcus massalia]
MSNQGDETGGGHPEDALLASAEKLEGLIDLAKREAIGAEQAQKLILPLLETIQKQQQSMVQMRQTLLKVPHSRGDHTDLCRMFHNGLPPEENETCHCHVAEVRTLLKATRAKEAS